MGNVVVIRRVGSADHPGSTCGVFEGQDVGFDVFVRNKGWYETIEAAKAAWPEAVVEEPNPYVRGGACS